MIKIATLGCSSLDEIWTPKTNGLAIQSHRSTKRQPTAIIAMLHMAFKGNSGFVSKQKPPTFRQIGHSNSINLTGAQSTPEHNSSTKPPISGSCPPQPLPNSKHHARGRRWPRPVQIPPNHAKLAGGVARAANSTLGCVEPAACGSSVSRSRFFVRQHKSLLGGWLRTGT